MPYCLERQELEGGAQILGPKRPDRFALGCGGLPVDDLYRPKMPKASKKQNPEQIARDRTHERPAWAVIAPIPATAKKGRP